MTDFKVSYSGVDRMVHNLAMNQLEMQKMLAGIEDKIFQKSCAEIEAADPVFITSLPRAGTTLLLEVISAAKGFTTHTYRHMPFVLCPQLWDRISRHFRKRGEAKERAHGDGMLVDYDSVEAFEEVLWLAFWPEHFKADRIRPWTPDDEDEDQEFPEFLHQHMRKIIALRRQVDGSSEPRRYVSKNNANIARLAWLERHFPDATILIPYRDPRAHIGSLLRQHTNFLKAHDDDPFVLRYMETIGHLEFGKAMRPIDFAGWLESASALDPTTLDFWAEYWITAFEAILQTAGDRAVLFSYDRLCTEPEVGLRKLETVLSLEEGALASSSARFRPPKAYEPLAIEKDRLRRIDDVMAALNQRGV